MTISSFSLAATNTNSRSAFDYMITKILNFRNSINEKGLCNIAVGEARGICLPETSGGRELKGAGAVLAFLARRDGRGLVRTEAIARRSAGRRSRATAEPLPMSHHAYGDGDPERQKHRHYHQDEITANEDVVADRFIPRPLQKERRSVQKDGRAKVSHHRPEKTSAPLSSFAVAKIHSSHWHQIEDAKKDTEQNYKHRRHAKGGEFDASVGEVGVWHRQDGTAHDVQQNQRYHLQDDGHVSPLSLVGMCYRVTMTRFLYCRNIIIVSVGSQARQKITISGVPYLMIPMIKKFSVPKIQYEMAAERSEAASSGLLFPKVSPRQESNPHLSLRTGPFYPLNYRGGK